MGIKTLTEDEAYVFAKVDNTAVILSGTDNAHLTTTDIRSDLKVTGDLGIGDSPLMSAEIHVSGSHPRIILEEDETSFLTMGVDNANSAQIAYHDDTTLEIGAMPGRNTATISNPSLTFEADGGITLGKPITADITSFRPITLTTDGGYKIATKITVDGEHRVYGIKYESTGSYPHFSVGWNNEDPDNTSAKWIHQLGGSSWKTMTFGDDGNLTIPGTFSDSDARLKKNIRPLESPLSKVCSLRGIRYNWKSDNEPKDLIGFLAQEVEEIIPEVVKTSTELADGKPGSPTFDNQKSVAYSKVVPYLVEAIKEQQKQIDNLQTQLEALK